jgi:arylsulfatase A-like enzyme
MVERRDVLKGMFAGAGVLGASGAISSLSGCAAPATPATYPIGPPPGGGPNIVVIMVDQMRFPKHFPAGINSPEEFLAAYMPNVHSLWTRGVPFGGHHTAAQACTPARNTMVTGLHARQTYMLNTRIIDNDLTLQPEWPTYGKLLRKSGYRTPWIGKWHLSGVGGGALDQYGFETFTVPDPVGRPDGQVQDPLIADQAVGFLSSQTSSSDPFCATVSFVNPHDKQFFWALLDVPLLQSKGGATCLFNRLGVQGDGVRSNYTDSAIPTYGYPPVPDNFEPAAQLQANKPYTQWVVRETFDTLFGTSVSDNPLETGFTTNDSPLFANDKVSAPYSWWARGMDMYTKAMVDVDQQVGRVLASIPAEIADNTVIVFAADHGEYGGSHGLSGKAGTFYDECVRVPLIVVDPRPGKMTNTGVVRTQLTSSMDFLPLLVGIAQGGMGWRTGILQQMYGSAADLLSIVQNASAPGRPYIVSTSDEFFRVAQADFFMIGLRNEDHKLITYWPTLGVNGTPEVEFYDYSTPGGLLELDNQPSHPVAATMLEQLTQEVVPLDLLKPVPSEFATAQTNAINTYNFNRSLWDQISAGIVSLRC